MMWRWIVLALVAANGGFWLWSHGELRALDLGPIEVSEPARLKSQIQPEALRVTPQEPAAAPATPASLEAASTTMPAPAPTTAPSAPAPSPPKGK